MEEIKMEKKNVACEISEPSLELKDSYLPALEEYKTLGIPLDEGVADYGEDFTKYVQKLKDESKALNLTDGRVPQTTFWITDKDGYAGRISIRHELNEKLLKEGGNIGYGIIPSKRGLGYGTKALKLTLEKAKELGFKPLGIEGDLGSDWVLLDLADIIVHAMTAQARGFYQLEKLWSVEGNAQYEDETVAEIVNE